MRNWHHYQISCFLKLLALKCLSKFFSHILSLFEFLKHIRAQQFDGVILLWIYVLSAKILSVEGHDFVADPAPRFERVHIRFAKFGVVVGENYLCIF